MRSLRTGEATLSAVMVVVWWFVVLCTFYKSFSRQNGNETGIKLRLAFKKNAAILLISGIFYRADHDQGNAFFPPTSFQIANIQAGTGASNVIPGELSVQFNFRFSTESTSTGLVERVETLLNGYDFDYQIHWTFNGEPFLTDTGVLLDAVRQSIEKVNGQQPELLTTGGTSDGRFIAPTGAQVIELGPCNATIHKVNECVKCDDLIQLTDMYQGILEHLLV